MELAVRDSQDVDTRGASLGEMMRYSEALAAANSLPRHLRGNPADVLYALRYAEALNIPDVVAFVGMHCIEGLPVLKVELIKALIRRAGHRVRTWHEGSIQEGNLTAHCRIVRSDEPDEPYVETWNIPRAVMAKLLKDAPKGAPVPYIATKDRSAWSTYPETMMRARALTACAREATPEVLMGIASYTEEEVEGFSGIPRTQVQVARANPAADAVGTVPDVEEVRRASAAAAADAYRDDCVAYADDGNQDGLAQLWRGASAELPDKALMSMHVLVPEGWTLQYPDTPSHVPLGKLITMANRAIQDGVLSGEGAPSDVETVDVELVDA